MTELNRVLQDIYGITDRGKWGEKPREKENERT